MTERQAPGTTILPSGVPGLDAVLGGGFPSWSLNLIAGGPGTGKTTLAQQIMFANAAPGRPAIYFTVMGEPPLKVLRYQRRMRFFDPAKLDGAIHFVNLDAQIAQGDPGRVMDEIRRQVEEIHPSIVVIDSFRAAARLTIAGESGVARLQSFVEEVATYLAAWQTTSFLVGEYGRRHMEDSPVFTVADGIIWLHQSIERNSIVRKLQVTKMRGQAPLPGLHTYRITEEGIQVFPRIPAREAAVKRRLPDRRLSTGIGVLDEMMGGGIPAGDAVLVAGTSGTGKSVLATQFVMAGMRAGEPAVVAVFEEHPEEYVARAQGLGLDMQGMIEQGKLKVIYLRPLDLSVDEALQEIRESVRALGAQRVVIDSISGFELALAPTFRADFRESLYRLVSALTGMGVTVLMTVELWQSHAELRYSPQMISFLADDIIALRYVEIGGQLKAVISVAKMRGSAHSRYFRLYEIADSGMVVGEPLEGYRGIIGGTPYPRPVAGPTAYPGLSDGEAMALRALVALGQGSAEDIAKATGLQARYARRALSRSVELGYATLVVENGRAIYRPAPG